MILNMEKIMHKKHTAICMQIPNLEKLCTKTYRIVKRLLYLHTSMSLKKVPEDYFD